LTSKGICIKLIPNCIEYESDSQLCRKCNKIALATKAWNDNFENNPELKIYKDDYIPKHDF